MTALTSLYKSPKRNNSLQGTMALNNFFNQENAEKDAASQQEAAYYQRLNKEADKMLAPDRRRFDEMVSKMQGDVRSKIAMYGGDRREFLKNGGRKVLENFSQRITSSKEYEQYTNNKANYVKIKDALEKGYGNRVTMRDKKALEAYEATGEGNLSYSGLMANLDMPNQNDYTRGEVIPPEHILGHDENYTKVLGNYMMNFPDDTDVTEKDLISYIQATGIRLRGSNREKERAAQAARLAKTKAAKDVRLSKDTRPELQTTRLNHLVNFVTAEGSKVSDYFDFEMETFSPKNRINKESKKNEFLKDMLEENPWKNTSYALNEDEQNWDVHGDHMVGRAFASTFGDRWSPAEANEVLSQSKQVVAEYFLQKEAGQSGRFKLDPAEVPGMFSSKGVSLEGSNNLELGEYRANYENLGVITGLITKDKDGSDRMVMRITDDDGEVRTDAQKEHLEAMDNGDSEVNMRYFIALRNSENDRIYYKKINMEDSASLRGLSTKLGSADDLRSQHESSRRLNQSFTNSRKDINNEDQEYSDKLDSSLLTVDSRAAKSSSFIQESRAYENPNDLNQNRSSLIKAFYAATGLNVDKMGFSQFMSNVPEADQLMRTYGHDIDDEGLIDVMFKSRGEDLSDQEKEFQRKFKSAYKRYMQINKE